MPNKRYSKNISSKNNFLKYEKNVDKPRQNNQYLLNKSFVAMDCEKKHEATLDEAASQIRKMERTSSPNSVNLCEHCSHGHAKECCLYFYDEMSDIARYASFKEELDEPYWIMNQSEDFDMQIGNVTPKHFPCFTENDPDVADRAMLSNYRPPPLVYLRQYLWPIFLPPIHQVPVQNMNLYQNPANLKYNSPPLFGNYFQNHLPHPYIPPVMRQVAIPLQIGNYDDSLLLNSQPQVIESHSFMPIHYGGGW